MESIMAAPGQRQGHPMQQDFDFFLVVDFEATCVKDGRIYPQEIIEFPAVLVDAATGGIESAFRRELTGIRQEDVDGGVDLGDALWLHDAWLKAAMAGSGTKGGCGSVAVVTWGDWDCRTMLEFECRFKGITKPSYFDRWVNLRVPFQATLGDGGRVNLQEAVRAAGLDWEGRLHCGLDDARNTARLLVELIRRGAKISITGSLVPPPPPKIQQQPQPHTGPCSGSLAPPLIQQQQQPHVISTCGGGSSGACICYCGVATRGGMVSVPGPMQGRCFFGCGNWTPAMGAACPYFVWTN